MDTFDFRDVKKISILELMKYAVSKHAEVTNYRNRTSNPYRFSEVGGGMGNLGGSRMC